MGLSIESRVALNDGAKMPLFGLGVWQAGSGKETQSAVQTALEVGYRLIDTAKLYANEKDVGIAVKKSGVPRDDVFVTTKLWNTDHGYEAALKAFDRSQRELGLGIVDLYLIHWPVPGLRRDSWKALLRLKEEGRIRSAGVSNYTIRHLEELLASSSIPPAVNQVEFHPFLYQERLLEFCRGRKIQVEAYSPLARARRLGHPVLKEIATKYGRTPVQILIRWGLQHDLVVIPKSVRPERIRENAQVFDFDLRREDMERLDGLDEGSRVAWNPDDLP